MMRHKAGGSTFGTVVGYGLTAGLFVAGLVALGAMLALKEILGGAGEAGGASGKEAAP